MDMILDRYFENRELDKQEYYETLELAIECKKEQIENTDNEAEKSILKEQLSELERIAYE